jgi:MFS family permease
MLRESFLGHNPSHFIKVNPIVRAYIISESFLWSAWNFITPIFAVFATNHIEGGSVQVAASAFSAYLIARVMAELACGRYFSKSNDSQKITITMVGIAVISFAYLGFAFATSVPQLFLYYSVAGIGLGIASPAKNSLFSIHLDKNKETTEWSFSDASSFISMALASALGGFIAAIYGYKALFIVAYIVNMLAIPPYIFIIGKR